MKNKKMPTGEVGNQNSFDAVNDTANRDVLPHQVGMYSPVPDSEAGFLEEAIERYSRNALAYLKFAGDYHQREVACRRMKERYDRLHHETSVLWLLALKRLWEVSNASH